MRVDEAIEGSVSFALAAGASFVLTVNVVANAVHDARTAAFLLVLLALTLARCPWLWVSREAYLYLAFTVYMLLSFLWTSDVRLAVDILISMLNFLLILVLFTHIVLNYDLRCVLWGLLAGLLLGAASLTMATHFPLVYPEGLSYNTVAGMYLFTLIVAVLLRLQGWGRLLLPILCVVLWAHIVASTSIKTNLGVVIALMVATLFQFRGSLRLALRSLVPVAILAAGIAYYVASHPTLEPTFERGWDRVSMGVGVLLARQDDTAATGLSTREDWKNRGLRGWARSPLFGNGAEAFRADVGITSHSTIVDLLYNTGLIGFGLFYGILGSVGWRWFRCRDRGARSVRAMMLGVTVCYAFISISGLMYYDAFLPAFIAIAVALHQRYTSRFSADAVLAVRSPRVVQA
jgi:hypothetical protein